jgi:hypothetical protein
VAPIFRQVLCAEGTPRIVDVQSLAATTVTASPNSKSSQKLKLKGKKIL